MTRVLIAVDDSDVSVEAARTATELFGPDAEYLVVNVAEAGLASSTVPFGFVAPYDPAAGVALGYGSAEEIVAAEQEALDVAEQVAETVAQQADVEAAQVVSVAGDPASAIVQAAHEHHADVIVVGSHEHGWFARLFDGSVRADVVRTADIPVLVVK